MTRTSFAGVLMLLGLSMLACTVHEADPDHPAQYEKEPGSGSEVLADNIAHAGHGKLFDAEMKEIILTPFVVDAYQASITEQISKHYPEKIDGEVAEAIDKAQALVDSDELKAEEAQLVQGAIIRALLQFGAETLSEQYSWRNEALLSHLVSLRPGLIDELRARYRELLERLGLFVAPNQGQPTSYMRDCRAHDVPIPPDWAQSGTKWQKQGTLTTNLLDPGAFAEVWTYSDPGKRGGCIALPRGTGAAGSPAGIICQSATTGHACFWDNKKRGVSPEAFLGWSGKRLIISELKDGSNLNQNCTTCHRGNNVFLISPDDATWQKVLKGPLNGPRTGTFTTQVESSSDNRGGHPRYIPITTLPERPGWVNALPGAGCAGACHETPSASIPRNPPMPPTCSAPSYTDPSNCYGTP